MITKNLIIKLFIVSFSLLLIESTLTFVYAPDYLIALTLLVFFIVISYTIINDELSKRAIFLIFLIFLVLLVTPAYYLFTISYHCSHDSSFEVKSNEEVKVIVGSCEEDISKNIGIKTESIAFAIMEKGKLGPLNFKRIVYQIEGEPISNRVIMHELGHTMGMKHTEYESIMSPLIYSIESVKKPKNKSIKIAREFDNYKVINWNDKEDYEFLKREHKKGNLSIEALSWSKDKYKNSDGRDIYYKSNFNGFGGTEEPIGDKLDERFFSTTGDSF